MNTEQLQTIDDAELDNAVGGGEGSWAYQAGAATKAWLCSAADWAYHAMYDLALASPPSY